MKKVDVHTATVKTAAVEVKTLQISGKQMTLSVFRQLVKADLICPVSGAMQGKPWGIVNYHWKGCGGDEVAHLHVVWQVGNELRRDCVPVRRPRDTRDNERYEQEQLYSDMALLSLAADHHRLAAGEAVEGQIEKKATAKSPFTFYPTWHNRVDAGGGRWVRLEVALVRDLSIVAQSFQKKDDYFMKWAEDALKKEIEKRLSAGEAQQITEWPGIVGRWASMYMDEASRIDNADDAWGRNYATVAVLDQLFIAV